MGRHRGIFTAMIAICSSSTVHMREEVSVWGSIMEYIRNALMAVALFCIHHLSAIDRVCKGLMPEMTGLGVTYIMAREKDDNRPIFRPILICKFQTYGIGSPRIIRSVPMLNMPPTTRNVSILPQCPFVIVLSQLYAKGEHIERTATALLNPQAQTMMPVT